MANWFIWYTISICNCCQVILLTGLSKLMINIYVGLADVDVGGVQLERPANKLDLDTYLSKNERFMYFIYDRREIQTISSRIGLSPRDVRAELKKRGYQLISNDHGLMVWKKVRIRPLCWLAMIAVLGYLGLDI